MRKQKKWGVLRHGTANGYNYYKCRCKDCRKANALRQIPAGRKYRLKMSNNPVWVKRHNEINRAWILRKRKKDPAWWKRKLKKNMQRYYAKKRGGY